MVIKVFIAGISSSKEVKKHQQRALFVLDSLRVEYQGIDICDAGHDEDKEMIKEVCKRRKDAPPLTPQFFNDDEYCGDWDDFYIASDEDRVLHFLKLADDTPDSVIMGGNQGETVTSEPSVEQHVEKPLPEALPVSETIESGSVHETVEDVEETVEDVDQTVEDIEETVEDVLISHEDEDHNGVQVIPEDDIKGDEEVEDNQDVEE
ncbi:SH3 domain-binding glutamic acid-rich -like protein [Halotydeus destructor]|nr:SH3 domain-binding glutamic acid-rich -like protein [Halotydeus destructor]